MLNSSKIDGVILKRSNFGEADKLVTIFSKQQGKIKVLAKGIRRIKSKRAPHLELFNYTTLILHHGKSFDIVTEAKIINDFSKDCEKCIVITNNHNLGLAKSYNRAIQAAKGDLIVTMHADMVLEKDALPNLIAPFDNPEIVAAGHSDNHPHDLWKKYNFWQKCFFARLIKRHEPGINGQFD